jgi:hypothetical protein
MLLTTTPTLERRDQSGLGQLLPVNRRLMRRNQSGLPGLAGSSPDAIWNQVAPAGYYTQGAEMAARLGYSIPVYAQPTASNAMVLYVNPDGTWGTVTNWQAWPVQLDTPDASFVAPSQTTWGNYLSRVDVANLANAANEAAAMQAEAGDTSGTTTGGTQAAAAACDATSFAIAGTCIPYWAAGLAAAAALMLMSKRRRK